MTDFFYLTPGHDRSLACPCILFSPPLQPITRFRKVFQGNFSGNFQNLYDRSWQVQILPLPSKRNRKITRTNLPGGLQKHKYPTAKRVRSKPLLFSLIAVFFHVSQPKQPEPRKVFGNLLKQKKPLNHSESPTTLHVVGTFVRMSKLSSIAQIQRAHHRCCFTSYRVWRSSLNILLQIRIRRVLLLNHRNQCGVTAFYFRSKKTVRTRPLVDSHIHSAFAWCQAFILRTGYDSFKSSS